MQKYKIFVASVAMLTSSALQGAEDIVPKYPPSYSLCVACHGVDGNSIKPHYPILAGQHKAYLYKQLVNFKDGKRLNSEMSVIAKMLSLDDIDKLSTYFSEATRAGEELSRENLDNVDTKSKPTPNINQCFECHELSSRDVAIPSIKGQKYLYILKQLQDFKSGNRLDFGSGMAQAVSEMSDADMQAISMQISGQIP